MAKLTLAIGNKTYSSWSLRPWLLMKHGGVPFEEVRIALYTDVSRDETAPFSPSKKVPALTDGELRVWESLAICETIAERHPETCGWPTDAAARAVARSISSEMHAGFSAIRNELCFYAKGRRTGVVPSADARAEIERACEIVTDCRARFGAGGPWLFGAFSPADAMYAPLVLRFLTYGVALPPVVAAYAAAIEAHPAVREWCAAARRESEVLAKFERGTLAPAAASSGAPV